jgi:hypothetical protein
MSDNSESLLDDDAVQKKLTRSPLEGYMKRLNEDQPITESNYSVMLKPGDHKGFCFFCLSVLQVTGKRRGVGLRRYMECCSLGPEIQY